MKEKGMTTITLKKINREKVYQYIYQQKETSKLQIVQDLQMGLSTVSQNLNELENDGLISRNGYFESTGGRKAQIIKIVEDFRISIGLHTKADDTVAGENNLLPLATDAVTILPCCCFFYFHLPEQKTAFLPRQCPPDQIIYTLILHRSTILFCTKRQNRQLSACKILSSLSA